MAQGNRSQFLAANRSLEQVHNLLYRQLILKQDLSSMKRHRK